MSENKTASEKRRIHLRIQFIHKPVKRSFFPAKYSLLVQNEPFEYGIRVKNIGSVPFSGAEIRGFGIKVTAVEIVQRATKESRIRPLNPGEECEVFLDKYTLWHQGSISTSCDLVPASEGEEILTYQHHRDHDIDEPYKVNEWWHDYYCQGQQELLQTKTNNLVFILTIITLLESIFGISNILKFAAGMVAQAFKYLYLLFQWIGS